ncbi:uncharacterized protein THITE_2152964 [Thermothielavioides terrestris NRRL 8126]|uniref:Spindle pole body-associated protein cut12 domain-containing protein n=1 Tax=Thermothielavioides terrestris (strain ATCC 38088 / NRRL 8126) TaxID=578455 RepID=G2QUN8_THETT|nr:uncharacterized protein THITE_2152964 [Thermothielavioides terrestris NRRL 8126]AEO62883.1 hypothetical protein THITE_2152964 [Thermothielavioides terrestris NRRL 8126]
MISWALKRNSDSARDAPASDDTTQIDLPDTPAPVFAVRALRDRRPASKTTDDTTTQQKPNLAQPTAKSPVKTTGILLTPGTGTARRKRVSFDQDVKQGSGGAAKASTSGLPDECPGKFPSPWIERGQDGGTARPKTRLQQAMENSRKGNAKETGKADEKDSASAAGEPEDVWEEVDDNSEFEADMDITIDLNEPHSRSGKYWKSYFETYHRDAKVEMEKLVKYKHLAKSYAKMKDAEAVELSQKLKAEQEKVKAMEQKKNIDEAGDGHQRQQRTASPRTQRTLMEAQRELRRARSQIRELDKLQEERDRLSSELKYAEQRASKLAEENRKLTSELSQTAARVRDLEQKLGDSKGLYEKLKDDAKARYLEAQQVLEKKNEKILELEEEIESLRRVGTEPRRPSRSTRAKSFDEKGSALKSLEQVDNGTAQRRKELEEMKLDSSRDSLTAAANRAQTRQREKRGAEVSRRASFEDRTLAQSRALRERLEAESGTKALPASGVFGERGNLQDSQSSASSGRSAHLRDDPPHRTRTDRLSRATREVTSAEKPTLDALIAETRERRARATSSERQQQAKKLPTRPLSREAARSPDGDLAQGDHAHVAAGTDGQTSAVWSTMSASRAALPAHRKAAAIARLQRKKAERAMQLKLLRDKENSDP